MVVLVSVVILYQGMVKNLTKLKLLLQSGYFSLAMPAVYQAKKGVTLLVREINSHCHEKLELLLHRSGREEYITQEIHQCISLLL